MNKQQILDEVRKKAYTTDQPDNEYVVTVSDLIEILTAQETLIWESGLPEYPLQVHIPGVGGGRTYVLREEILTAQEGEKCPNGCDMSDPEVYCPDCSPHDIDLMRDIAREDNENNNPG